MYALFESLVGLSVIVVILWLSNKYFLREIQKDLEQIKSDLQDLKNSERGNLQRIDHLYEIAIETLKTRK